MITCDKCGKRIDYSKGQMLKMPTVTMVVTWTLLDIRAADLCIDCQHKLIDFIYSDDDRRSENKNG